MIEMFFRNDIHSIRGIPVEKGYRTKITLSKEAYEHVQNMYYYNNDTMDEMVDILRQLDMWFLNAGIKI